MSMFQFNEPTEKEEFNASVDAAARCLSVAVVDNDFVKRVYGKLTSVYDFTFGPTLHAGRLEAIKKIDIRQGDQILEVGVGTGINAMLFPRDCWVTGIDLSDSMLEKAHQRIARRELRNVKLLQMDAAEMEFPDNSFDVVYAPYLISVVPDPVKVTQEMFRVCRVGGRVIILNHFLSPNRLISWIERLVSPLTVHIGFKSDLDLPAFLARSSLKPISIEKVNIPRIWSLVMCQKE